MSRFEWLETALDNLGKDGAVRDPNDWMLRTQVEARAKSLGVPFVDASSNDYLGYASGRALASVGLERAVQNGLAPAGDLCGAEIGGLATTGAAGIGLAAAGPLNGTGRYTGGRLSDVSRETSETDCPEEPLGTRESDSGLLDARGVCPVGAGASRLLGGSQPVHTQLEAELATWVGQEASLLFSSGYAANVGLLSSIATKGDTIFSDALNHASIIDGCRLSPAAVLVYPHLDLTELGRQLAEVPAQGRRFVVTESYFSMDADSPDLRGLRRLCTEQSACLIVDEAHALGVFGSLGAGLAAEAGVLPDVTVGTLGKAVGLQGAFVAGPAILRTWLWNRARSFVFSTGTSPVLAAQTLFHVKQARRDNEARALLAERSTLIRQALARRGTPSTSNSHGPIIPVVLGTNNTTIAAAAALRDRGILAYPVRPPTVPTGTARLRLTLSAASTTAAFQHLLDTLATTLTPTTRR